MHRYIANRVIQGALTGLLVSIVIFAILRIAPGDVAMMIALEMTGGEEDLVTEEQLAKIREDVGLNAPIYSQYLTWIGGWLTGDWGESMFSNEGIWENFLRKLPVTVELALLSIGLSTILGLPAGVLMALRKDTWIDYTLRIWSLSGLSIPNFWLATMLLVVGMYVFEWSPQIGFVPFFENPTGNMTQFFWPALIVGFSSMVTKARMMRSTMLEVLRQDYIRTAHAKGLSGTVVTYRHAMKNAFIPVITVIGFSIAGIIGGSVIMERIFVMDGIGNMLVEGMNQRDYPVVQSLVLLFSMWIVITNLLVDLSYGWLDPRIRFD
jgi:peptide/nickel transport system permease protein